NTLTVTTSSALTNEGILGAEHDVSIQTGALSNTGTARLLSNQGAITLQSAGRLDNQGVIRVPNGKLSIKADKDVSNQAIIAARDGLLFTTQGTLTNSGVISSVQGSLQLGIMGDLTNQNGKILNQAGSITLTASHVDNQHGTLQSAGDVTALLQGYRSDDLSSFSSQKNVTLNSSGILSNNGMIRAGEALTIIGNGILQNTGIVQTISTQNDSVTPSVLHINVASFSNSGTVSSAGPMLVESGAGLSNSGLLLSSKAMSLHAAGQLDNRQGRVGVQQGTLGMVADGIANDNGEILTQADDVSLKAKTVSNKEGKIQAGHGALIEADQFNNQRGNFVNQQGTLTLSTPVVLNEGGQIESDGDLKTTLADYTSDATSRLVSQQAMTLSLPGAFDNEGILGANEGLTVQASSLHNGVRGVLTGGKGALSLTALQGDIRNEGTIEERDRNSSEHLSGADIMNNGTILSAGGMTLTSAQDVTNTATVYGAKGLAVQSGGTLNNQNGMLVGDGTGVQITSAQLLNNAGNVRANTGTLAVQANKIVNDNGQLSAAGDVVAQSGTLLNRHGVIQSGARFQVGMSDAYVDNQAGILQAGRDMSLTAARMDNGNGQILGLEGGITLNNAAHGATNLANASGAIKATGPVNLALTDVSSDTHSIVSSVDHLTLNVASPLEENGLLSGGKGLTLTTPGLMNTGMIVSLSGPLAVTLGGVGLTNQGTIAAQGEQAQLGVSATGALVNHHTLFSAGTMTLENQQAPSSGGAGLDNAGGKIGSSSTLTLQGAGLNNAGGMIFSDVGDLNAHVTGTMNNHGGVLQAGRGATLVASSFDNDASGVVNAGIGGLTLSAGDHGLRTLDNTGGTLQSNGGMYLATQTLNNTGGRILQQALDRDLVIDAGGPTALTTLMKGSDGSYGLLQTQGGLQLAVDTTQGMGTLIAPKDLTITTRTTDGDNFFQAGRNVTLNVLGDYMSGTNGGVFALGGNASVTAHSITNQGALFAQNGAVSLQSESDIHNTGIIRSEGAMQLHLPGTLLNDEGSIVSHNGSLTIAANNGGRSAAVTNRSGEIRADAAQGTLLVRADTITNALVGTLKSNADTSVDPKADKNAGEKTIQSWGRGTRTIEIPAVTGQLDDHGKQVTGYLIMHASTETPHHNRGQGRFYTQDVTYTADHAQPILVGAHDVMLDATGGITNYVGVVSAGHDLYLNGTSLDNKAYQNARHFYVICEDHAGCGWDSSHTSLPYIASASDPNWTSGGHKGYRPPEEPWGAIILLPGLSSMIVAGHNLVGTLSGKITNSTMIAQPRTRQETTPETRGQTSISQPFYGFDDTVGFNGSHQGYVTPTAAAQNKAVALPGFDGSIATVPTKAGFPQPWMTPSSTASGQGNALGQAAHAADGSALTSSYSGQGPLTTQGNATQLAGGIALHEGGASPALQPPSQGGLTPAQTSQTATSMTGQSTLTSTGTYAQANNGGTTLHLPPTSGDSYHNASSIQVPPALSPSAQQRQNVHPPEVSGQTDSRGTTINPPSSSAPSAIIPAQGGGITPITNQSGPSGRPTAGTTAIAAGHAGPMSSAQGQNSPPAISQGAASVEPLATGATLHVPSANLNVIVSSIPAGKSFFVPNPSPSTHYLLETR
ncbi:beta strand repeat-containing protein, partial [Saccharibacter floricola]